MHACDALEFLAVGAAGIQVGTASFIYPKAAAEILEGIRAFLAANGYRRLEDWSGCMRKPTGGSDACEAEAPHPRRARAPEARLPREAGSRR